MHAVLRCDSELQRKKIIPNWKPTCHANGIQWTKYVLTQSNGLSSWFTFFFFSMVTKPWDEIVSIARPENIHMKPWTALIFQKLWNIDMSPGLSLDSNRGISRLPCEECVSSSHCRGLSQITSTYFCIDYVFVSELTLSPSSSCANTCVASATAATTPPSCQEKGVVDWSSENTLNILQPSLRLYWQGIIHLETSTDIFPIFCFVFNLCLIVSTPSPHLRNCNHCSLQLHPEPKDLRWARLHLAGPFTSNSFLASTNYLLSHKSILPSSRATLTSRAAVAIRQFTFGFIMSRLS